MLTHADVRHLGALPYVPAGRNGSEASILTGIWTPRLTKYPVSCPVVCTEPVCRLGELSCVACLEDREKYREPTEAYDAWNQGLVIRKTHSEELVWMLLATSSEHVALHSRAPQEVDDVLRIFMSRLTTLKYRETFRISVNGRVLAACPYPAGSHLGSAFWSLNCGSLPLGSEDD